MRIKHPDLGSIEVPDDFFDLSDSDKDLIIQQGVSNGTDNTDSNISSTIPSNELTNSSPATGNGLFGVDGDNIPTEEPEQDSNKVVESVVGAVDKGKEILEDLKTEYGEDKAFNALVEAASGKAIDKLIDIGPFIKEYGPQAIDLATIALLNSGKVAKFIPDRRVRIALNVAQMFALFGGSITEAGANKLAENGVISKETAEGINKQFIEPAEKLTLNNAYSTFKNRFEEPQAQGQSILVPGLSEAFSGATSLANNLVGPWLNRKKNSGGRVKGLF